MNDDEISSDEKYIRMMNEVQKTCIDPDDWEKSLLKVKTEKIAGSRDLFVAGFARALMHGELPDAAIQHLAMGMLMNPEEAAVILDVTFKKGEGRMPQINKELVQVAIKVAIENNGILSDISDVSDEVFDAVASLVSKEPETVKKYYSKELPSLRNLFDTYCKIKNMVKSEKTGNDISFIEFLGVWLKEK